MKTLFRAILFTLLSFKLILGADSSIPSKSSPTPNADETIEKSSVQGIDETRNRFPEILSDAKLLMSEIVISDFNKDTLEVAFLLSRVFELMMEADQIGEMNLEDKEEFESFLQDRYGKDFDDLKKSLS